MNEPFTEQERERAADDWSGEMMRLQNEDVRVPLLNGDAVIIPAATLNLACQVNRLTREVEEAKGIIGIFDDTTNPYAMQAGWDEKRDAWLSRNGGGA